MIPIPKGGKVCSTTADLYRSISISSVLSKMLDYVIIDQHAVSLATSDYQFGFKSYLSTMLCSTMLNETIMIKIEDKQFMHYFWMQVKHSIVFVIVSYLIFC